MRYELSCKLVPVQAVTGLLIKYAGDYTMLHHAMPLHLLLLMAVMTCTLNRFMNVTINGRGRCVIKDIPGVI